MSDLRARGIGFRSLTEQMDTATPQGEFLFHVFGALAQFERSLIQERVQAGLAAARRRGRRGGRPTAIDAEKLAAVTSARDYVWGVEQSLSENIDGLRPLRTQADAFQKAA